MLKELGIRLNMFQSIALPSFIESEFNLWSPRKTWEKTLRISTSRPTLAKPVPQPAEDSQLHHIESTYACVFLTTRSRKWFELVMSQARGFIKWPDMRVIFLPPALENGSSW